MAIRVYRSKRENAYEEVDATVFSSDMLHDKDEREIFKTYLKRWIKAYNESSPEPESSAEINEEDM